MHDVSNNYCEKDLEYIVSQKLDKDFNQINLELLEKAYPNGELYEKVIYPKNYSLNDSQEPLYPLWNILFEAKNAYISKKLKQNINELERTGIYILETEETNAMMFVIGAGYDFYSEHWIPLYRDIFKEI